MTKTPVKDLKVGSEILIPVAGEAPVIGTVVLPPTQDSLGKTRLFVESSIGFLNVIVPNHGVVNTPALRGTTIEDYLKEAE